MDSAVQRRRGSNRLAVCAPAGAPQTTPPLGRLKIDSGGLELPGLAGVRLHWGQQKYFQGKSKRAYSSAPFWL